MSEPAHSSTVHATLARIAQFVVVRSSPIGPPAKPTLKGKNPSHQTRHKPGPQNDQKGAEHKKKTLREQRPTSLSLAGRLEEHRAFILSRVRQETFLASRCPPAGPESL